MGDTFLRNFVSTYDYKNGKVILGINVNAPDGVSITKKLSPLQITGIVAASILALALIALMIWCCCKKCKKNKTNQEYEQVETRYGDNGTPLTESQDCLRN